MLMYVFEDSECITVKCTNCGNQRRINHNKINRSVITYQTLLIQKDIKCGHCGLVYNTINNLPEKPIYKNNQQNYKQVTSFGEKARLDAPVEVSIFKQYVLVGSITLVIMIAGVVMWVNATNTQTSLKQKSQIETTVTAKSIPPTNYSNKKQEIGEAFHGLLGAGGYSRIYDGLKHEAPDKLIISVNDGWSYLSNDARIGFVNLCWQNWNVCAKARGININNEEFKIEVVHSLSGRKVASWDSLFGTSIK